MKLITLHLTQREIQLLEIALMCYEGTPERKAENDVLHRKIQNEDIRQRLELSTDIVR